MKFKYRLLTCNALILIMFVAVFSYSVSHLIKTTSDNQLSSIKENITGYNRKLLFSFVQAQNSNLDKEIDLITEQIEQINFYFSHELVNNGNETKSLEYLLSSILSKNKGYIKSISLIEVEKQTIYKKNNGVYGYENYKYDESNLFRYKNLLLGERLKENKKEIEHFYLYSKLDHWNGSILRIEFNLNYFTDSLYINNMAEGLKYRYILVDSNGRLISSNLRDEFEVLLTYFPLESKNEDDLAYKIMSNSSGFSNLEDETEFLNITFLRNKKTGWRIILVTPDSVIKSSYSTTKAMLLDADSKLIKYFFVISIILLLLFLFVNSFVIKKLTSPLNNLMKQANSLRDQDYEKAIQVINSNNDEIEQLSYAYSEAGRSLKDLVEGLGEEVKERTKQYEEASKDASEANRQKSILLSNVSHEVRTPLNAIIGYVQMLSKKMDTTGYEHFLNGISSSSYMILNIVNDLLDLERLHAHNYVIKNKDVLLSKLLEDINMTFIPLATNKNLSFIIETINIESSLLLMIDELRFKQALSNIITNAIKFTHKGSVTLLVERNDNDQLIFNIIDTGVGIPKEKISTIFNSFEQVNDDDKTAGFGLGLAITKTIIGLMNGELLVESFISKGSKFSIILPPNILSLNTVKDDTLPVLSNKCATLSDFKNNTVLIVDDVEFNREILQFQLEQLGINCLLAESGKEAINIFDKNNIDIVFTDISMPGMDGIELSKILRKKNKNIPIIAVTARATVQEESRMNNYFDCYITKPLNNNDIVSSLYCVLTNSSC